MEFGFGKPGVQVGPSGKSAPTDTAPGSLVKETTTANFTQDVIEASKQALVLVDFWADWCGPCKQLAPLLEKVVNSYGGKVRLVKLNVDQHPAIPGQLRIQSLPTVYAFRDGRPLDGFMGAQPESAIKEFIDRILGEEGAADITVALDEATKALDAGDLQGAAQIYAAVLQQDQQNPDALAGLARCYLTSGDVARAEQTIELVPPAKKHLASVTGVLAAIDLAKQAGSSDDLAELEQAVSANPDDHQARIDLAKAYAARGDKEKAVDQLVESFRRNRDWDDQAARKQLVQFFEAWGPKDPFTVEGRRRLSTLLFA